MRPSMGNPWLRSNEEPALGVRTDIPRPRGMWSVSPSKHDRGAGIPQEYPGGIAPTYVYPQGYMYKCAYGVFKNTVKVSNQICQR